MIEVAEAPRPPSRGRQAFQWLSLFAVIAIPLAAIVWLAAPGATCACTPLPSTPDITSPVDGIVVEVDASGLTQVRGFTLRTTGGTSVVFRLGVLENATEFTPSHLAEHQATSSPIRVSFRVENGDRVVYRLEDAPPT